MVTSKLGDELLWFHLNIQIVNSSETNSDKNMVPGSHQAIYETYEENHTKEEMCWVMKFGYKYYHYHINFFLLHCLRTSNTTIGAADATFKEFFTPYVGISAIISAPSITLVSTPVTSFPTTNATFRG